MMKKIITLIAFALAGFTNMSAQDCDLPSSDVLNTGANMTVMLLPGVISSLNATSSDAYLVALRPSGEVVGSTVVAGVPQTTIAVWGNDSSSDPVIDGALAGEIISFQLVDGTSLYDVQLPNVVSYTTNDFLAQATATVTEVDCSVAADVEGCMDASANNYNADATVDDGSCTYDVEGCTDSSANNFDSAATVDDASCTYDVEGCMDASANNYNADANVDDASCTYDQTGGDGEAIEYQLSSGWNMVGYTGTADNNGIVEQMDAALGNGAGTANTFQVIKNVSGQFWSAAFAQINTFNQGQGYMMYVNGATTTVNFQQTSGYISGIEYVLSAGWNMVAFTGDVNAENNIVSAMDAALANGAGTANTFQVIKNVSGQFWSAAFAQINTFNPGQAYMMYVNGSTTTVNFQQ